MVKDTHQLRRSVVALLQEANNLSYQEITDTFQALGCSPSAVRTAYIDLKTLGYVEKVNGSELALKTGYENAPTTTSADLYASLTETHSEGAVLSTEQVKNLSPHSDPITTESAIQALLRDGGLERVSRGVYKLLNLPPLLQETKVPVCPERRKVWFSLLPSPCLISDLPRKTGLPAQKVKATLRQFDLQGVLDSDGTFAIRAQEYSYSEAEEVYFSFNVGDTFTNADLRKKVRYPANVIKTLLNSKALQKETHGLYRVLPLPPLQDTSPHAPKTTPPQETTEQTSPQETTSPEVASFERYLQEALEARKLLDQLLAENSLSISKVNGLRASAHEALRQADEIEAQYKEEKERLQEREQKAREALQHALKQADLL